MRSALLAVLLGACADDPPDVCTDALVIHMEKGCPDAFVGACPQATGPLTCGIEACHRHEPVAQCAVQFDTWIACIEKDSPLTRDCDCVAEADALVACVGE